MSYDLLLIQRMEKRMTGGNTTVGLNESDYIPESNFNENLSWDQDHSGYSGNGRSVILKEHVERGIVERCYAYFVEEDAAAAKGEDKEGMWRKFSKAITSQLKRISDYIEGTKSFQSFIQNEHVDDIKKRVISVGNKYKGAWNSTDGRAKQMAKTVAADAGAATIATLVTYAAYKGTNGLSAVIEQRYGKVAGIIAKVLGMPLAAALTVVVWGGLFLYRDEVLSKIDDMYQKSKSAVGFGSGDDSGKQSSPAKPDKNYWNKPNTWKA